MLKLKSMAYFNCSYNQITGCIPEWFRVLIQPITGWGAKARLKLQTVYLAENKWEVRII